MVQPNAKIVGFRNWLKNKTVKAYMKFIAVAELIVTAIFVYGLQLQTGDNYMSIIERECVLNRGVVSFINSKGKLSHSCQRCIKELKDDEKIYAIETGVIDPRAFSLRELPKSSNTVYYYNGEVVKEFDKRILY